MRIILYLVVASFALCNGTYSVTFKKTVESDCNCTEYDRSFHKVLRRNKRWFVFPAGASVLLTMVLTKTVLDGIPRGLQESMEVEMGFQLPPWVEGWNMQPYLDSMYGPIPKTTPSKGNQSTAIVAQPKTDTGLVNNILKNRRWHSYGNNRRMQKKPLKYSRQKYTNHSMGSFGQYPSAFKKPSFFYKRNKNPSLRSSHYHREFRERRQIFEKFEGLSKYLGIDIKSCIMRAICEVKEGLMPEGESFIQDVARIVFTIPIDDEFEDDYTDSARSEEINCIKKFSVTCPFSPMEFLLKNGPRAPPNWNGRGFSL